MSEIEITEEIWNSKYHDLTQFIYFHYFVNKNNKVLISANKYREYNAYSEFGTIITYECKIIVITYILKNSTDVFSRLIKLYV